jgi:hypothetical protein
MPLFLDRVMIHTPTLTTRDGEIIQISPGKVRMQKTQPQGHTIKLSPTDNPTTQSSTYQPPHKQYQAAPAPRSDSNFEDRMLKMMSDMSDRVVGKVDGRIGEITQIMGEIHQTVNSHSQSIAKLETQLGQMANTLNRREEGKLPS